MNSLEFIENVLVVLVIIVFVGISSGLMILRDKVDILKDRIVDMEKRIKALEVKDEDRKQNYTQNKIL